MIKKTKKNGKYLYNLQNFFLFSEFFCWLALQFLFSDRPDFVFHNKNPLNLSWSKWYWWQQLGNLSVHSKNTALYAEQLWLVTK